MNLCAFVVQSKPPIRLRRIQERTGRKVDNTKKIGLFYLIRHPDEIINLASLASLRFNSKLPSAKLSNK